MFSRLFSRMIGRRCGSRGSTSPHGQRRPSIDALESRVLLSTIYVDASAPGPTYDGSSWATAYTDLQLALSASVSGDEIRVADGTYKPTSTTSRSATFTLRDGVAIYGGYAGSGASDPDLRDILGHPTILSGDIGTAGSKADNSFHVLTANGVGPLTVLDGITVTEGNANLYGSNGNGGGVYATDASPTMTKCTFSGNSASAWGGAIYSYSSSPTLTNCTFSSNSSSIGGAMYNQTSSSPTLIQCTFIRNSASNAGGIYNNGSSPMLLDCTFSGNSASTNGGAIWNVGSSPLLTNCTVGGNSASYGGGMYNSGGSPQLANCTFSGNSARTDGGGMYNISSLPTLANCTFSGNAASITGGGMYNRESCLPRLTNCIIWGNTNGSIYSTSGTAIIAYSDIEGGYAGTGNINADPLFVRNPWTGPDGLFGTADDGPGDLRLRPGSPALNIGSNAAVSGVSTDLAGNARIQNGTVDMGAYEGMVAPVPKTLYVDLAATGANSGISWADAFTSLQSALTAAWDGDTIRLADGTYKPTSTTDRTLGFALRNAVAIYGGYAGYGASDPDARDIALYPTILSGDIGTAGSNSDNSYHVLTASRVGASTVLDGVTVTGGNADGTGLGQNGGGLHAANSSPKLISCTFIGNAAATAGGGVYNTSSSPALINCTLIGNSSFTYAGGGMYNTSSSPLLVNCTFSSNWASYGGGGGMHNYSSSPALTNCSFSGNSASIGGGMYSSHFSSPTLTNCIVWGNTAPNSPQILQSGGTLTITYSDIQGGYTGTGNINADPLFVRSPSPGPDGLWNGVNDDYGDLRLQQTSPCVDRGNNAASGLAGIIIDLAGRPRFMDIALTLDAGAGVTPIIDMGAYETEWWCPAWLTPGEAIWDGDTYSLDIGSTPLNVVADETNRAERLEAIRQFIASGRAGGAGIVSSAASEDRGVVAALDGEGNILVRLALLGDVTLDDQLDGDDYFAMDMAFLAGAGGLRPAADVNVDGVVDGRDYLMLDAGFLRGAAGGVQAAVQQVAAGVFSVRSIAEELSMEEEVVLA